MNKQLKTALRSSRRLFDLINNEDFSEEKIGQIQQFTKKIKKFMSNFERDYDFFARNMELENLNGGCLKQLSLIHKEVRRSRLGLIVSSLNIRKD